MDRISSKACTVILKTDYGFRRRRQGITGRGAKGGVDICQEITRIATVIEPSLHKGEPTRPRRSHRPS
ncbi:hypothetical protein [Aldersonia kunmingensis]|uniref:hypothetical protein n=1 Tax=Aldersonia kunmingensis TaxID=408066 RepID=UPI0012EE33B9|nr:hypothetical protein [Aldersonia kunmingensis]